jgi:hypothetical protein
VRLANALPNRSGKQLRIDCAAKRSFVPPALARPGEILARSASRIVLAV